MDVVYTAVDRILQTFQYVRIEYEYRQNITVLLQCAIQAMVVL